MSIQVKVFDEKTAKQELKNCPKIVRDYVKLLEECLKNQQDLTSKAISKLREKCKEVSFPNNDNLLNEITKTTGISESRLGS